MPISYFKTKSAELLETLNRNQEPIVLTQNGFARAVVMSMENYNTFRNQYYLKRMVEDSQRQFEQGLVVDHDEMFDQLEKQLKTKKSKNIKL